MTNNIIKNIIILLAISILVSSSMLWLYRVDIANDWMVYQNRQTAVTRMSLAYTPHDPIVIVSDSNFSTTAALEGWLGDGSAGDPYIIESLEIDRGGVALHCINISNTRVNFTIRNCNLTGASNPASGIYLENVTFGRIEQNIVYSNHFNLYLTNSHYVIIKNNTCWGSVYSISMRDSSSNNTITDNDSSDNSNRGLNLESGSHHNTVINNTCINNVYGIVLYLVTNNTITKNNFSFNTGQGIHSNRAESNYLLNNICNRNTEGMYMFTNSNWNEISNNTFNNNTQAGIDMHSSDYNTLTNNTCNYNYDGIYITISDYTRLNNNTCNGNDNYGLHLSADYCNITNNVCKNNPWGLIVILTDYSRIINNTCNFNGYGIEARRSTFNIFSNNTCTSNTQYGLNLNTVSTDNIIEWNAFIENVNGGTDEGPANTIDYNFWSDYNGNDLDQDGIGDTPYPLFGAAGNQDAHPLMMLPSQVIAWIDPPSDQFFDSGQPVFLDLNASAFSGIDSWIINDTSFNIDSFGVITNSTILPIDVYGLEVTVNDTKGNTLSETFMLTVLDTPPQWIEAPTDQFVAYFLPFYYDLNAVDYDGLDWWWINDTVSFTIDQDGTITNATALILGEYGLEVFVNDTKGNTISAEFKVNVLIYAVYDSIVIDGDDEFHNFATNEGWQGDGSALFPYTIEYVIIDRNDTAGHCVSISNTRVHFIVRHSIFFGASINPGSGIYLNNVTNSELENNTCFSNYIGIYLYNSSRNSLINNNCSSNSYAGIFLLQYSSSNTIIDNTCHGNPVGIQMQDAGIEHDVIENVCYANSYGIYLLGTSFSTVENNTCNSNLDRGIHLQSNSNNTVSHNICINNTAFGLVLYYSHYNDVFGNNCSLNGDQGVHHRRSNYNNIFDNVFNDNGYGYYLHEYSDYNILTNNVFKNNTYAGIYVYYLSDYNTFSHNLAKYNSMGLLIQYYSGNNEFLWNIIADNDLSSRDYSNLYNFYDYNYWSRYTESDLDGDGVGDTPYSIDGSSNQDSHPLMMMPGSSPSWVNLPEDQYADWSVPFLYDLDVTLYSFIDYWWINDTSKFHINQQGIITNVTPLDMGTYGVEVWVNDTSGYLLTSSFNVIVSDFLPPTWDELPITQVIELSSDFHYDLNASDLSGLDMWWLNDTTHFDIDMNGVVTNRIALSVGIYGLNVWVNDTFGCVLESTFDVIVVDTTAPVWVIELADQQYEEGAPFIYALNADDLSELHTWWVNDTAHFIIDGFGVLANLTILPEGTYPCEVRVNDTYGNTLLGVFTLTVLPATTPTWVIEPTDQFVEFGADFLYVLDASDDSGINSWWLNDTSYFAINQSGVITNIAPLPVGVHRLLVSVNDLWGHTLSHGLVITVADTTAPSWVESPENQVVEYGSYLNYDLDVYDASELDWWVDDTDRFTVDWTGRIRSLIILDVGTYGLRIYVSDAYGHELMARIIIEVVDTTPPEWLMTVEDQYLEYGEPFLYQLSAYDLSGIDTWSLNDTVNFEIDSLGLITSKDYLDEGGYGLSVTAMDAFGNEITAEFTVFIMGETTTTTTSTTTTSTTTTTTTTSTTSTGPTSTTPTTPQEPDPILTLVIGLGLGATVAVILVIIIFRRRARGA